MKTLQAYLDSLEAFGNSLFVKRLSANDTLATGAHQAGLYLPKKVAFSVFPSLGESRVIVNPRIPFAAEIISHDVKSLNPKIIWYNNKTRDECHITGWGGASSPLLDPESTGSLCIFGFYSPKNGDATDCQIWICSGPEEEDEFEQRFDAVDPGAHIFYEFESASHPVRQEEFEYEVSTEELQLWDQSIRQFPTGQELIDHIVQKYAETATLPVDKRLLRRRELEYVEFRELEKALVLPRVRDGFSGVDQFIDYANSVTNRRKARSGRSLELHMVQILREEGITEFAHDQVTEGNKRPDFVFPSIEAYRDSSFASQGLRMLACKTTCKDRWRQVIDEAPRIPKKHLLTLQQGVSENQFEQMQNAGIRLVVPQPLFTKYPKSIRGKLIALSEFVEGLANLGEF